MPNTKPYNKEEVMKEIDNLLFLSKEDESHIEHVDMAYEKFLNLIESSLTAAEQVGEERMMEKAREKSDEFEMKQFMTEEEVLKAFNSGPLYFCRKK